MTLPVAHVRYAFEWGGYHFWNLTEPLGDHLVGATLSEKTINALGYSIPDSERPGARSAEPEPAP